MKRRQWAPILLAIFLFASGAAVGALGHRYYTATVVSAKEPHTAEDFRRHYLAEMQTRLNLTPAQFSQLQSILDQTKAKYKAVRDSYHPQMAKIREEQINEVKTILTPGQIPEYDKLVKEREERAREQDERDQRHGTGH